jgi:hypothetical protein
VALFSNLLFAFLHCSLSLSLSLSLSTHLQSSMSSAEAPSPGGAMSQRERGRVIEKEKEGANGEGGRTRELKEIEQVRATRKGARFFFPSSVILIHSRKREALQTRLFVSLLFFSSVVPFFFVWFYRFTRNRIPREG